MASEKAAIRHRFAAEHGCAVGDVARLVLLGRLRAAVAVRCCNGDPYTLADGRLVTDRDDAAHLWDREDDRIIRKLKYLAGRLGFDAVTLDGLYPHLQKAGRSVTIPY